MDGWMDGWMDPKISFRVSCPPSFSRDWWTSLVELRSNRDTFHLWELVAHSFEWATIECTTLFKVDTFSSKCWNEWHDSTLRIIIFKLLRSYFVWETHPPTCHHHTSPSYTYHFFTLGLSYSKMGFSSTNLKWVYESIFMHRVTRYSILTFDLSTLRWMNLRLQGQACIHLPPPPPMPQPYFRDRINSHFVLTTFMTSPFKCGDF
jgi:hypothetical protein